MKALPFIALATFVTSQVIAEEARQVDAHEHGVGKLDIAFDGQKIVMELHAPGADIVGFEYEAKSADDLAAIDAAIVKLTAPLGLFTIPADAKCGVIQASAELESETAHGDEHADHDDDHHKEHADHADHDDDQHKEHTDHEDHVDHDEDKHEEESGHTEFHAEYLFTCSNPNAVTEITFAYFDTFPNALELEIQAVSSKGANAFEVERDNPTLDLRGMF